MSSLSSEQYQLLIETIKDVEKKEYDDIHLYFEGQIEELKNFKDTSQSTYNTKNRYYKVKPTFIHYNTDIFGQKKGNIVEAFYEAYVENGEVHLKKSEEEAYGDTRVSTSKINELSKKAVNEHFSNVYAGLATFLDDVSIDSNSRTAIKKTNEIADALKKGTLTYASFRKILDNYSYSVLLLPLDEHYGYVEGQEPAPNALIAVFYGFKTQGFHQLRDELIKSNFPLLLGGFLFIILFSYLISYMTTRRIKEIDRVAMEITNNNFKGVLDTKGHDELSSLSSHINTMSSNLKRNIDALNLEIDQVKKMEQLRKEFIAQFTHEIKTPLAIINGNIDLLENVDDEDKKAKYIEVINKEISVINDLVLQMLDLSKLEAKAVTLDKKEIDLRELTEDIVDDYEQLLMDKKLKIKIHASRNATIQITLITVICGVVGLNNSFDASTSLMLDLFPIITSTTEDSTEPSTMVKMKNGTFTVAAKMPFIRPNARDTMTITTVPSIRLPVFTETSPPTAAEKQIHPPRDISKYPLPNTNTAPSDARAVTMTEFTSACILPEESNAPFVKISNRMITAPRPIYGARLPIIFA